MAAISENIKRLREVNGYSQTDLAQKIGVTRAAVSQYENGVTIPRMGVIERMAHVFSVPKSELIESKSEYAVISLFTDDETELLELYRSLPTIAKRALLAGLREYGNK